MRPPIRTKSWLSLLCSFALVVSVLSSPIRAPRTPDAGLGRTFLSPTYTLAPSGPLPSTRSTTPDRVFVDADGSDFEEEDEEKSFAAFFHLLGPTFIASNSPPKLISLPRQGNGPLRIASVPLRC